MVPKLWCIPVFPSAPLSFSLRLFCLSVGLGMALLAPFSTLCLQPAHQLCQSTSVGVHASGLSLVSRSVQVGCVLSSFFSFQFSWTTTHLLACLPALTLLTLSPQPVAIRLPSFISTLVCVSVLVHITNHNKFRKSQCLYNRREVSAGAVRGF